MADKSKEGQTGTIVSFRVDRAIGSAAPTSEQEVTEFLKRLLDPEPSTMQSWG